MTESNRMNNFSISTSDLASSLQESVGTLKLQGNSLEEAIAMTVAGNSILQDPDKVGAGLRTISLRIAGTEEAKEELEGLGEDVSDFVTTTTSKLNESVKGLTAVASNGFQGVSLVDDNGQLKGTYEILQDIADIYAEIQEQDKATGNNNAQALVEKLAGKNRASVLSSIFDDPDLLRNAYNQAQDASGSALQENQKYLDSIEGRLTKLTATWEEFWGNFEASDAIKSVITALTNVLDVLNSITKATSGWGTALTVLAGGAGISKFLTFISGKNKDSTSGGRSKTFLLI